MSWQFFSLWGYLSILLWLAVPVMWGVHFLRRPRRWLCHYAVVVALAAFVLARINSLTHVNRIQIDHSSAIAEAQARQEAARKAAEAERSGEVAQIRFAEDDANDFLDTAGMDEADRKYIESFDETVTPEWKKEKKTRGAAPEQDDSLEGLLDTGTAETGMDVGAVEGAAAKAPILMTESAVILANRLDRFNLKLIRWLAAVGVGLVLLDYLRRVNVYEEAYGPLPLPSGLVNSLTPQPASRKRPDRPRRPLVEDLAWLVRRGDAFLYLAEDAAAAAAVPETLCRLPRGQWPVDVLHLKEGDALVDDRFVFEALWYSRASFVVDSAVRAEGLLACMVEQLRSRRETRARVRQTVHVVCAATRLVPESLRPELVVLLNKAGWSLWEV